MKKKSTSQSAPARRSLREGGFFNLRVLIASVFCLAGVFIALVGAGLYLGSSKAQAQSGPGSAAPAANPANGPDVVRLIGPVRLDQHLKDLPYIPPAPHIEKRLRKPYEKRGASRSQTPGLAQFESLINGMLRPVPTIPSPLLTFGGISLEGAGAGVPPDTNGDVGPNHYVQSVNDAFRVFDKSGKPLMPAVTFNSFFRPLHNISNNPCGTKLNQGDPFVFYDQLADRWVITDFAFAVDKGEPAPPYYECIGVSQTPDPTGKYFLYALPADPENPMGFGDYPKFGLWPDAYYLTMNEFFPPNSSGEHPLFAVRVYALDRASMIAGGPANAVGFTIISINGMGALGHATSLVPATFRTGDPPPAGQPEFLLAVDGFPNEVLTQVKGWLFHVDFDTPANSTLGVGVLNRPNALITVSGFLNAPEGRVPQPGTVVGLDAVGDRLMTPVVYQNRNGTESLYADKTVFLSFYGPSAIRWYQFDVTGGTFPDTPVQQQDWSNGNDGLWRFMPSIAVDANGNVAIGYSVSSQSIFPGIRYAGRRPTDPLNDLSQGEAIMTVGRGSQTGSDCSVPEDCSANRWGDYTMTTIDPSDGVSFWHTNEYLRAENENWFTRVGKFQFGPMSTLGNISARAFVQTGDNVMIGGFMVQGTERKRVIIRAIGPELTQYGVPDPLANPTLELHDGTGDLIASNNTWLHTIIAGIITSNQVGEIQASGHAPGDPRESAIIADLQAGNYTAIVSGVNNTTGVALVEVYDLSPETDSILSNISARSFVQTGDNVMIGGFMVQGTVPERVIIRAIGPELGAPPYNVPNALANPTLELHDGMGALIASNNNWVSTIIGGIITSNQVPEIQASGHAPGNPFESAIIATLQPGNYTAIVSGVNNTTGVALVEVYNLQ